MEERNMTRERKAELISKARKVLTGVALERYINFINNYETQSKLNDMRLQANYPYFFHTTKNS